MSQSYSDSGLLSTEAKEVNGTMPPDHPPSMAQTVERCSTQGQPDMEKVANAASFAPPDSPPSSPDTESDQPHQNYCKTPRVYFIMAYLTLVTFAASVTTGLITTSVPTIATDLDLSPEALFWPLSIYSLTNGAALIVAGAVADVVGSKRIFLTGNFFLAAFVLACGLSRTSIQLTVFRALQGIAVSMCLPTSVAILCDSIAPGRRRNLGFACTGLGQPLGFSLGLVFGGVFINTVGWRVGWYVVAAIVFAGLPVGFFLLPSGNSKKPDLRKLRTHIDWPGAIIVSLCLALLAYILLELSEDQSVIREPSIIALLTLSLVLIPTFVGWMHIASRRGLPVLIPNRLWKQTAFTGVCLMVLNSYAVLQVLELYCTLFFQKVQDLDALQSSIRLLPSLIIGALLNLTTGLFIHRASTLWLVLLSSLASSGASLLMALINPSWPYWYAAFPAQILEPLSADVLFCVGLIVISETFPDDTQALAGAVFNTVGQFGTSIGLSVISIIANSVTQSSNIVDKNDPRALEMGYRAAFWTSFALTLATCAVAIWSLRGLKSAKT